MTKPIKYQGTFTDAFGTTEICVVNDFVNLYTEIEGVKFKGQEFSDFSVIDKLQYTTKQLGRFTFYPMPIYSTDLIRETLCNCIFEIIVPQLIINKSNQSEFYSDLKVEYALGFERDKPSGGLDFEQVKLSLTIDRKLYTGTADLFELAFDQIRDQFEHKYHFKNCYGCMYGDYSVYGQSSFGTMLCFVSQKDKYRKVTNKGEYMELEDNYKQVQEVYCCSQYEIRKKGAGYRG